MSSTKIQKKENLENYSRMKKCYLSQIDNIGNDLNFIIETSCNNKRSLCRAQKYRKQGIYKIAVEWKNFIFRKSTTSETILTL